MKLLRSRGEKLTVALLALFLSLPATARALPAGTMAECLDEALSITPGLNSFSMEHVLEESEFMPPLDPGDQLSILGANWMVFFGGYTPGTVLSASLDGQPLGTLDLGPDTPLPTYAWAVDMSPSARNELLDLQGLITMEILAGSVAFVGTSNTYVVGTVVPEPMSLLLLGSGLLGLGAAVRKSS